MQQEARMRRIRRRARVRKHIVRYGYHRTPQTKVRKSKREFYNILRPLEVFVPQIFSIANIGGVISFIHKTETKSKQSHIKRLIVRMDKVVEIDMYAISLLLSMLNRLSRLHIKYIGTYPTNSFTKQYILESGFLDVIKTNIKKASERQNGNQIFMVGKDSVDSHLLGKAVKESMSYILGSEKIYPPLYDDLLEISANSVEHANENILDKNWLVSISIEKEKLHFIVTDTGLGILQTLKKKWIQLVQDKITKRDSEILLNVFKKGYQSMTGELNRHKGLPIIYESFLDGFISDFKVLTNKVFFDFDSDISTDLPKTYHGVLYSWTISQQNYNNWLNSLQ